MKLKTYRVKMTRIKTMEIEVEVKARNEDDALRIVEADLNWEHPDPCHAEEHHEITEVK